MKKYAFILLALAVLIPKLSLANVALGVTNITAVKTSATANNTYADGWKWIFNVTVPTGEDKLQMKFADWTNGALSIPAGSNMHFYSVQSLNATSSDSAIDIDSANAYGNELILDPSKGQQVQVAVEIKVPAGTTGGSYSTSYGIQTNGTTTASSTSSFFVNLSSNLPSDNEVSYSSQNAPLAQFSLQTQSPGSSILNSFRIKIDSNNGTNINTLISNIRLFVGSTSYGASSVTNDGVVLFDNLNIPSILWHDLTIKADGINGNPSVFSISTDLLSNNIVAVDVNGNALITARTTDNIGNTTFTPWLLGLNNTSKQVSSNGTLFIFSLINESNSDLYISKTSPTGVLGRNGRTAGDTDFGYNLPSGIVNTFQLFTASSTADSLTISYGPDSTNPTALSRTFNFPNY